MWRDVKEVRRVVQSMMNAKQPHFVLRYTAGMASDGEKLLGFDEFKTSTSTKINGVTLSGGSVRANEAATFYRNELGIPFAALPDTKHNRNLLCACIGDAPIEIENEGSGADSGFQKELAAARKKNVERLEKRQEANPVSDPFNMSKPVKVKPVEGATEAAAVIKKVLANQNNAAAMGFE